MWILMYVGLRLPFEKVCIRESIKEEKSPCCGSSYRYAYVWVCVCVYSVMSIAISYSKDLPDPGIESATSMSPALQVDSLPLSHQRSPCCMYFKR